MYRNCIAGALGALVFPIAPAIAAEGREPAAFITAGVPIEAPRGFDELCSFNADWCGAHRPTRTPPPAAAEPVVAAAPVATAESAPGAGAQPFAREAGSFWFPAETSVPFPAAANGFVKRAMAFRPLTGLPSTPVLATEVNAIPVRAGDPPLAMGRTSISLRFLNVLNQPTPGVEAATGRRRAGGDAPTPAAAPATDAPGEMELLKSVNRRVNGHVVQRRDAEIFGASELWRRSGIGRGATGDCEDLAIEKRLQLIAEGYPPDRLSYAVVYRRDVGLHTILIARTGDGDFVLDSLSPYVRPWKKVGYSWIGMQSMKEPTRWFALGSRA